MRVLIIDDHTLFRLGLKDLLERRGIEVEAVRDGEEGIARAAVFLPDAVLLDLRMPGVNGLQVLRRLRETGGAMPIAMLTTSADERDLLEALRLGAQGYLLKDMDPEALVCALDDIVAGKTVVAPDLTGVLARAVRGDVGRPAHALFESLTTRELEILQHLAAGESNKAIGRALGISDGTVKLHVKAILRKLGVHSRVEAAVLAVERGVSERG